eukprot:m51a1_g6167 putative lim-type zinc finger-containing protein (894) ;mRNA; r:349626-353890
MAGLVRRLMHRGKRWFDWQGLALELSYITDNLIAMEFPSEGLFASYGADVATYLDSEHGGRYRVFNLCAERRYDRALFHGAVAEYPTQNGCPPSYEAAVDFCKTLSRMLESDPKSVGVVHCRNGKGRTAALCACWLIWSRECKTAPEALRFFTQKRTPGEAGTCCTPSQQRFVKWFATRVTRPVPGAPPSFDMPAPTPIVLREIDLCPAPRSDFLGISTLWMAIRQTKCLPGKGLETITVYSTKSPRASKAAAPAGTAAPPGCGGSCADEGCGCGAGAPGSLAIPCDNTVVSGDFCVELLARSSRSRLFSFCLHTAFIRGRSGSLTLALRELDGACKDRDRSRLLPADLRVTLVFDDVSESLAAQMSCEGCGARVLCGCAGGGHDEPSAHCRGKSWHMGCMRCSCCGKPAGSCCAFVPEGTAPLCIDCARACQAAPPAPSQEHLQQQLVQQLVQRQSLQPQQQGRGFFETCGTCGELVDGDCREHAGVVYHKWCFRCGACGADLLKADPERLARDDARGRILCPRCSDISRARASQFELPAVLDDGTASSCSSGSGTLVLGTSSSSSSPPPLQAQAQAPQMPPRPLTPLRSRAATALAACEGSAAPRPVSSPVVLVRSPRSGSTCSPLLQPPARADPSLAPLDPSPPAMPPRPPPLAAQHQSLAQSPRPLPRSPLAAAQPPLLPPKSPRSPRASTRAVRPLPVPGPRRVCARCGQGTQGTECASALGRVWHARCFACARCGDALPGMRYFACGAAGDEPWCAACFAAHAAPKCKGCGLPIVETSCVELTGGDRYHLACLSCVVCGEALRGEVVRKDGKAYCKRDYDACFAVRCAACGMPVSGAFLALGDGGPGRTYHRECLRCRSCKKALGTAPFFSGPPSFQPTCSACHAGN